MDEYARLTENLGKLRRNEGRMTEEQKKKYAAPLKKLKHEIAKDATVVMNEFLVSGCWLMKGDEDSAAWKGFVRAAESFIADWARTGGSKDASRALFKAYDNDAFLAALLPLHYQIWYEAYGPYWLSHCAPTLEEDFTFANDIIGMEWWAENNEWTSVKAVGGKKGPDLQKGWAILLPPTRELLDKAYKEDLEAWRAACSGAPPGSDGRHGDGKPDGGGREK